MRQRTIRCYGKVPDAVMQTVSHIQLFAIGTERQPGGKAGAFIAVWQGGEGFPLLQPAPGIQRIVRERGCLFVNQP